MDLQEIRTNRSLHGINLTVVAHPGCDWVPHSPRVRFALAVCLAPTAGPSQTLGSWWSRSRSDGSLIHARVFV